MQDPEPQKELSYIRQQLSLLQLQQQEQDAAIRRLQQRLQHLEARFPEHRPTAGDVTDESPTVTTAQVPPAIPAVNDAPPAAARTAAPAGKKAPALNWEKFIGENLINKIGIVILVIGIIIGAKYAIDKDLISPATRIITGYVLGLGLLGFAYRLKTKYHNFSAVLLSGAMTSLYFLTYAAYAHYHLLSLTIAFGLMLLFTIFTVLAALKYDKEIISILGMVGAYALPVLLGEDTGTPVLLLSYMAIINLGIYYIVYRKHWYSSHLLASVISWLVLLTWYILHDHTQHKPALFGFAILFFLLSVLTLILLFRARPEKPHKLVMLSLILNALCFFATGYLLTEALSKDVSLTGLFTIANATFYLSVCYYFHKQQARQTAFYLFLGLGLSFLTISIPIQLDGYFVTILWLTESLLFLWTARKKALPFLEKLSYIVFVLGCISIMADWFTPAFYTRTLRQWSLLNAPALSSIAAGTLVLGHAWIIKKHPDAVTARQPVLSLIYTICGAVILYITGTMEITGHTALQRMLAFRQYSLRDQQLADTFYQYYTSLSATWLLVYNFLFLSVTSLLVLRYAKHRAGAALQLGLNYLLLLIFLVIGLYNISELREHFLVPEHRAAFHISGIWLMWRYTCIALAVLILFLNSRLQQRYYPEKGIRQAAALAAYATGIWMLSSELIQWLDMAGYNHTYKLGLSILWGTCSLYLIYKGIFKSRPYIRIAAMVLFGVTLLKLFFYDLAHLNTLSKTIIFIILGILLLIISFLYNKYRHMMHPESPAETGQED